jgi:hypothetical protein
LREGVRALAKAIDVFGARRFAQSGNRVFQRPTLGIAHPLAVLLRLPFGRGASGSTRVIDELAAGLAVASLTS